MTTPTPVEYLTRMTEDWLANPHRTISNEGSDGAEFLNHLVSLLGKHERDRVRLRDAQNDLLEIRGILSPNPSAGQGIPDDVCNRLLGRRAAPAIEWLVAEWLRLARENERLTEDLATSALPGLGLNDTGAS